MSFAEYVRHGWALCSIPAGTKGPIKKGWQLKGISAAAAETAKGAGLLHMLSGTCALDVDDMDAARPWLAERDIDIDALLAADDAVQISSGRHGRAKLLYRIAKPLRTLQPAGSGLELRCASGKGTSLQDVLPPSIHPDTKKPYEWVTGLLGDWRSLPVIPPKLLSAWRDAAEPFDKLQPVETVESEGPQPFNMDALREALYQNSPNCEYPEWFKLGGQLHDATKGDGAGLDLWCEWSRGITRGPYPGDLFLKRKWLTMGECANPATGEALLGTLPAKAEDFDVIESSITPVVESGVAATRKAALAAIMERFVFVACQELYFDRERSVPIGDKAIRHMLTPFMPSKNGRLIDPVDALMRNGSKTVVEAIAFKPGEKAVFTYNGKQYGNTFTGKFPTPIEPMKDELEKIDWIFNRIHDPLFREWLRQFFAHIVQYPGIKIRAAPLILSKIEGNGKSMTAHLITRLLVGAEHYTEVDQGALSSDFNDYLEGVWAASLTEFRAGTRFEREAISKKAERWVADDTLQINRKGKPAYNVPNHLIVTASSNKGDAVQIDENNRKWAIHWLRAPAMSEDEKAWIFEGFLKSERGAGVLRHYFLNVPITTFSPNADAIKTEDRAEMIRMSTAHDEELLKAALEQYSVPLDKNVVITSEVGEYVRRHCIAKPSNTRIGQILTASPFNATGHTWQLGKQKFRGWILRNDTKWAHAPAKDVMAYVRGDDVDIKQEDDLLS